MALQDKYKAVLDLGLELGVKDGYVEEADGKLKIGGTAKTQYEKDQLWDKIKEVGGEDPADVEADIKVEETAFYTKHVVASGESLSKIAKKYYRDPMKYMKIFEANQHILKDPNLIHPGQELVIPNP
ncbi:MAG: LysM peptidoglycan-binding domain-containing protein [Bacteroidetes bacterium]|nr:MAG: LysM peptidoglycan-binding domain-containing protein [Bacteroidota bacterium]